MSTGISPAVTLYKDKFFTTLFTVFSETVWKEIFRLILTFCFILSVLGCLENLAMICSISALLLTDSPIHSKSFNESVTDSKYVLKVLAVLWFSETILSFSINVIFQPPCECLFEKYGLQVFQNGLVAALTFNFIKIFSLAFIIYFGHKLRYFYNSKYLQLFEFYFFIF